MAAIDGGKFNAMNSRDGNFTKAKLKARMEQVEASIERCMAAIRGSIDLDSDYLADGIIPRWGQGLRNHIGAERPVR